ncbi:MAG: NifX-associated nitrogen fixation protein [Synechococcaceae cyanobacterium SM2_3_1]|nr:NifX-associated nitrogen fixation protein [Synechococcaceae cyanobacterium SM2_3_1]
MTLAQVTANPDAVVVNSSPILQEIVRQIRSQDSLGVYRNWSDELLIKPYIVSKGKRKEISIEGEVDPITKGRILIFYRAIAARIEVETGFLCQVVLDLSHEGFGWVLVFSGRLLLVTKTLRDAQRFGFDSLEALVTQAEKLIQQGIQLAERHPEVGRL